MQYDVQLEQLFLQPADSTTKQQELLTLFPNLFLVLL